jgi:diketogulonate reductase-like aldo/keto reductase
MPVFGLGTWRMGEHPGRRQQEEHAIRCAIDSGLTLIDTAEMYGEGGAEEIIGDVIRGRRETLYIVSKVYPHNAGYRGVIDACERSLRRMKTGYIDLYLLHWPGSYPLTETFSAFQYLKENGKIRDFGVSNFDLDDLRAIPADFQTQLGCNQVFYNLAHREAEWAVVPWCRERAIPIMAYSPLDQGGLLKQRSVVDDIAGRYPATASQIVLAWLLAQKDTVVIPKSVRPDRIKENIGAVDLVLRPEDIQELDKAYPAPHRPVRLGMR